MTHKVNIRVPTNIPSNEISADNWFKKTTKSADGNKATVLFQRTEPRNIAQKISDFFSGIKKAKNSITLTDAFKCMSKDTMMGGKFNVNLIPTTIDNLRNQATMNPSGVAKPIAPLQHGNYQIRLEDQ